MKLARATALAACGFMLLACLGAPRAVALGVHVRANHLVDGRGRRLQLRGVNFSGPQYQCLHSDQTWDYPASAATVAAMRSWKVNAVRLPLNEDCWLGINGLPYHRAAGAYRRDVLAFIARLHRSGMYVLVNLHVAAPGRQQSQNEINMADREHGPAFWSSLAGTLRHDPAVIFDLYNEPKHISWTCWRQGCGIYTGMDELIAAVRAAGADQPVLADGVGYANDLSGWLAHRPADPRHQLAAGFHNYGDLGCRDIACWDATVARVAGQVPVLTGETGEFDCAHHYIDRYLPWADRHGVSYLAWAWNSFSCAGEPSLLTAGGTPSNYGIGYRDHLLGRPASRAVGSSPSRGSGRG